ncbi:hypothetical protein [Streptomyces jumonjinensis]|uniref:hypothetical protein n=1 Tax=Streptomyces jumonjinensis TaxID=1945 RepID=UPI0037B97995
MSYSETAEILREMRGALKREIAELSFSAGQLVAEDPKEAERLMDITEEMTQTLNRTDGWV